MSSMIEVSCDKEIYSPGETIQGEVYWNCSKTPSDIIIKLDWSTTGRGTTDSDSVFHKKTPCSGKEGRKSFQIKIPEQCPPSYSGRLISILWRLSVRADISWSKDPKNSINLIVSRIGKAYTPPIEDKMI